MLAIANARRPQALAAAAAAAARSIICTASSTPAAVWLGHLLLPLLLWPLLLLLLLPRVLPMVPAGLLLLQRRVVRCHRLVHPRAIKLAVTPLLLHLLGLLLLLLLLPARCCAPGVEQWPVHWNA
jgi:hypothetical protein